MSRTIRVFLWSGPTLLLLLALCSCGRKEPTQETVLRPVRTQQVFATGGNRVRRFSGVAQAGVESKISFRVGGTIQRISVDVGNAVTKGQLLAELDPEDYRLKVQDAEAALNQSKAQERNQSASYDRVRELYENRNASKQDLESARAAYESAVATVESHENRLELARNQLAYTKLKAPIDADVAEVNVEVNENVQPGQVVLLLTSGSNLEVQVAMPEVLISQVREGDEVSVDFDALPGTDLTGKVTEVGVTSTDLATTFPVTVRLDEIDPGIRSGMTAEVAFQFESPGGSERFLVPAFAVAEDREGRYVFVVQSSGEPDVGVVMRKKARVGDLTKGGIEILDGLTDGDHVVVAGVSKLVDGQRVKFVQSAER